MRLTVQTDYALRVLLYLALHPEETVAAATVSAAYGVSEHHVAAIAKRLSREGLVDARRGKGGGMRLAPATLGLRLGELVAQLEPTLDLLECFDPARDSCPLSPACRLKRALAEAQRAFLAALDGYTIGDLARNRGQLAALLLPAATLVRPSGSTAARRPAARRKHA